MNPRAVRLAALVALRVVLSEAGSLALRAGNDPATLFVDQWLATRDDLCRDNLFV